MTSSVADDNFACKWGCRFHWEQTVTTPGAKCWAAPPLPNGKRYKWEKKYLRNAKPHKWTKKNRQRTKKVRFDKGGIRTHAPCETRKLYKVKLKEIQ